MIQVELDTKRKILNASAKLFSEKSYYGVSMEQIAQEVGISKSSLYYHFDSKEDLLKTLLNESCSKLKESIKIAIQGSEDPLDCLFRLVQSIINYQIAHPEIKLLNTLGVNGQSDLPILQFVIELRTELLIFIRELLGGINMFQKWTFKLLSTVSVNILSFALSPFIQQGDSDEIAQSFSNIISKSIEAK